MPLTYAQKMMEYQSCYNMASYSNVRQWYKRVYCTILSGNLYDW